MGRSKVTLTIFVGCPCLVNTLHVFLTGIPVIIKSILSFIKRYCMGIACRIPVLVGLGWIFCISESGVLGSIPGLATYFRFSFRFFKKGSCQ